MNLRPTPRLSRAMTRAALPASTAADILVCYRFPENLADCPHIRVIYGEIIRAAFQNRHLTRDWLPYPLRRVGAVRL